VARALAGPRLRVRAVTARFGARYIADEASYAVAAHATLDAWACAVAPPQAAPDRVLVGCFGDPGLAALRSASPVPVCGLAEASFAAAARHGRFGIVTGGPAWEGILHRLAAGSGYADRLVRVHAVAPSGDVLAADRQRALALLSAACNAVVAHGAVDAVILGGAGVAGIAAEIQQDVPVPVIDSVQAGVAWALAGPDPAAPLRTAPGFDLAWDNVSSELTALGRLRR